MGRVSDIKDAILLNHEGALCLAHSSHGMIKDNLLLMKGLIDALILEVENNVKGVCLDRSSGEIRKDIIALVDDLLAQAVGADPIHWNPKDLKNLLDELQNYNNWEKLLEDVKNVNVTD